VQHALLPHSSRCGKRANNPNRPEPRIQQPDPPLPTATTPANSQETCRVAVLGASGYTGAEVVRLSAGHPHINIAALTGEKQAGKVGFSPAGFSFAVLRGRSCMHSEQSEHLPFVAVAG